LKAYKHLPVLRAALAAHQSKYSSNELNNTLTPHSITHGDACFAYFNKIWGIPARPDHGGQNMAQVKVPVIDPNNIHEMLCNGAINLSFQGQGNHALAVLTFTQQRPDATPLFEGKVTHRNIVRARIAMNVPNLIALRDLLINNVKTESEISPASAGGSAVRH
jgi:hypothetical protein